MANKPSIRTLEWQRRRILRLNLLWARLPHGERKRRVGRMIGREQMKLQEMRKQAGPSAGLVMIVIAPKSGRKMKGKRPKPRMRPRRF